MIDALMYGITPNVEHRAVLERATAEDIEQSRPPIHPTGMIWTEPVLNHRRVTPGW
jgi:hypothetical protein